MHYGAAKCCVPAVVYNIFTRVRVRTWGERLRYTYIYIILLLIYICICVLPILHTRVKYNTRVSIYRSVLVLFTAHAPLDFLFIAGINDERHHCNTAPLQLSSAITGRYSPRRRAKRTSFIYFIYICVKSVRAGTEITHRNA